MSTDDSKIHYATASEVPAGYGEPVYVTATEVKDEKKLSDPLKSSSRFYCHQCQAVRKRRYLVHDVIVLFGPH